MSEKRDTQTVYDRVYNCNPRRVANTVMSALTAIQDCPADEQLCATAVLMIMLTRRFGVEAANVMNCVDNMMKDSRRYDDATFQGVFDYFTNEL